MLSGIERLVGRRVRDLLRGGIVRDLGAELAGRAAGRISLLVLRGRLYASSMRPDSVALRASAMTRP
jgi:hypothetical protein